MYLGNKNQIKNYNNESLINAYEEACVRVDELNFQADYADYENKDYWYSIKTAIYYELLMRMGEFEADNN